MRQFKVIQPTILKVNSTKQGVELKETEKILVSEGTILQVDDLITDAGNGHFALMVSLNIFGEHLQEIKPDLLVSAQQAKAVYGRDLTESQLQDLNKCLRDFGITTPQRIRHFLSQTAHESGGLKWLKELATGDAYEGRKDLGNIQKGDGRRFKGAGVIQLTGRANYQKLAYFTKDKRVMEGCNYVAETYPFTSAGVWWSDNNMNALIDQGATVQQVTKRVNGGHNGLDDRIRYYNRALQVVK